MPFEGTYLYAFLTGLFFILLFAWDRLNQRLESDHAKSRQTRFVEMLSPSKLLRSAMYLRGWAVYSALLSIFFFLICSVGEPVFTVLLRPYFQEIGFHDLDPASPIVPLVVSLIITGVLPQFPLLNRLEEHARRLTHRLVGIPDSFNDLTDALFEADLDAAPMDGDSQRRTGNALRVAQEVLGDRLDEERVRAAMTKIEALEWIGAGQSWPGRKVTVQFKSISDEIRDRAQAVTEDIDDLIARAARQRNRQGDLGQGELERGDLGQGDLGQEGLQDFRQDRVLDQRALINRWEAVLTRLQCATDDVCAMMAIYAENARRLPRRAPAEPGRSGGLAAQHNALRQWIQSARRGRDISQNQFAILLQNLVVVAITLFLVGFAGSVLGYLRYPGVEGDWLARAPETAFLWLIGTIILYGPAAMVGWAMRLRRVDNGDWRYFSDTQAVFPWPQYLLYFAFCYLAAAASMGFFFFADAYFRAADETIMLQRFLQEAQWRPTIAYAFMGAVYATAMAFFFDLRDRHNNSRRNMLRVSTGLVVVLALICWFASLYHFSPSLASDATASHVWPIIWFQTFAAVVFGLVVSFSTVATLRRLDRAEKWRETVRAKRLASPVRPEVHA